MDKKDNIERINTKIATGFEKIEKRIAEAGSIAEVFEALCMEVEEEFRVPFVWITVANTKKAEPVVDALKSSAVLKDRLNIIKPEVYDEIFSAGFKPLLVNKNLIQYYKLFPPHRKYFVKSLALVPFKIKNNILMSWNNGDAVVNRYTPDMETGFLQKLARVLSARLNELV